MKLFVSVLWNISIPALVSCVYFADLLIVQSYDDIYEDELDKLDNENKLKHNQKEKEKIINTIIESITEINKIDFSDHENLKTQLEKNIKITQKITDDFESQNYQINFSNNSFKSKFVATVQQNKSKYIEYSIYKNSNLTTKFSECQKSKIFLNHQYFLMLYCILREIDDKSNGESSNTDSNFSYSAKDLWEQINIQKNNVLKNCPTK